MVLKVQKCKNCNNGFVGKTKKYTCYYCKGNIIRYIKIKDFV